ncbi:MAG: hypothetical protein ACRCX2_37005 [Paraclostridium sp.]
MKFVKIIKKLNSKNRPVNVIYIGNDAHAIKQLSKEFDFINIGENKCFYNKIRLTMLLDKNKLSIDSANIDIDYVVIDTHVTESVVNFLKIKIEENKKIKILSFFNNKKIQSDLGLNLRKKDYYEYYL